jgi:hypothetical protein
MISSLFFGYFVGWIVVAMGTFVVGQWLSDEWKPAPHALRWSIVAGAMWPLLIAAAVQMIVTVWLSRVLRDEPWPTSQPQPRQSHDLDLPHV